MEGVLALLALDGGVDGKSVVGFGALVRDRPGPAIGMKLGVGLGNGRKCFRPVSIIGDGPPNFQSPASTTGS